MDKKKGDHIMNNDDAYELFTFSLNEERLYESMKAHFLNLRAKSRKGIYDHVKAVKSWRYVADEGNKLYKSEFGYSFNPAKRAEAARMLADYFRDDVENESGWD